MAPTMPNVFIDRPESSRSEHSGMWLEEHLERSIALKEHFDSLRGWRKGWSLKVRRIYSSGQLLFEVLGVAGYAGYFAAMHTLMRLCSAVLLGGTWYAIYRAKAATRQLDRSAPFSSGAYSSQGMSTVQGR
ncbi:MAG: hypothetical protein WCB53_02910 [Terriglobales bacterium]